MKNDFSKQFRPMLELALAEMQRFGSPVIMSEHFMLASLRQEEGYAFKILTQLNIPISKIVRELEEYLSEPHDAGETTTLFEQQYKISLAAIRHLQLATSEARKMNAHIIGSEHILLALIHDKRAMDSALLQHIKDEYLNFDISVQSFGVGPGEIPQGGMGIGDDDDDDDATPDTPQPQDSSRQQRQGRSGKTTSKSDTPALDKFGYDMTKAAAEGRLDPVVGRENEIERLAQILSRRKKNNPVLIGEPGVGKSAIVEGLALRIVQRKVSRVLFDKRVVGLDMTDRKSVV